MAGSASPASPLGPTSPLGPAGPCSPLGPAGASRRGFSFKSFNH